MVILPQRGNISIRMGRRPIRMRSTRVRVYYARTHARKTRARSSGRRPEFIARASYPGTFFIVRWFGPKGRRPFGPDKPRDNEPRDLFGFLPWVDSLGR